MITIAIVNDAAIAVEALRRAIATTPHYQLLWIAHTGTEAVQKCIQQPPDLILMDLNMPELSGVEATRQIMQRAPCAILIVTASVTNNTAKVLEAMGYGALDVVATPALGTGDPTAVDSLLKKMTTLAHFCHQPTRTAASPPLGHTRNNHTQLGHTRLGYAQNNNTQLGHTQLGHTGRSNTGHSNTGRSNTGRSSTGRPPAQRAATNPSAGQLPHYRAPRLPPLIVIGTSTGGPKALQTLLSQLPNQSDGTAFSAAIVVIQHIDQQFTPTLVSWLNQFSKLPVTLASNGDQPKAGQVLIAGTNDHLILRPNGTLRYIHEPAHIPYRPSVDVFFQSVAQHWKPPGTAILLTGMGQDGAEGMALLKAARWNTIAQSAESCMAFGMPRSAIERNAADHILPLENIAPYLIKTVFDQDRI